MVWYGMVVQVHVDKCRLYRNLEWSHRRRDLYLPYLGLPMSGQGQGAASKSELDTKVNKHNILLFFGAFNVTHRFTFTQYLPTYLSSKDQFLSKSTNQPPFRQIKKRTKSIQQVPVCTSFATLINPQIGYKVKSQRLTVFSTKLKKNLNNSLTHSLTHIHLTPPTEFRRYAYTDISSLPPLFIPPPHRPCLTTIRNKYQPRYVHCLFLLA